MKQGLGIMDGRGYGPYGMGYTDRGEVLGPGGQVLPPIYDFQPNPDGSYMPLRPPLMMVGNSSRTLDHVGAGFSLPPFYLVAFAAVLGAVPGGAIGYYASKGSIGWTIVGSVLGIAAIPLTVGVLTSFDKEQKKT